MSIEEKSNLFSIRNRIVKIENDFGRNKKCVMWDSIEDMSHKALWIFKWRKNSSWIWRGKNQRKSIGTNKNFQTIFKKYEENGMKKNQMPCYPFCDVLNIGKFSIGWIS